MISKTMKTVLHALSYGNIEVDSSRKLADLKQLDATRIFLKKLDARVYKDDHEDTCTPVFPHRRSHGGRDCRGNYLSCTSVFSMEADG